MYLYVTYRYTHKSYNSDVFISHVQGCFQELQLNLKRFFLRDTRGKDIGYIMSLLSGQNVLQNVFGFAVWHSVKQVRETRGQADWRQQAVCLFNL